MLDQLKKKGKEHVKRITGLTDKRAKPNLHSQQRSHLDQSKSSRFLGSSSDNQASPSNTEASNHNSKSYHDDPPKAVSKAAPIQPSSHRVAASLTLSQHSIRGEGEPALGLKPVRSSTLRSRNPYEKLRDDVTKEMNKYEIGFGVIDNYLPEEMQQELVTEKRIRDIFQGVSEPLVTYITREAPRTFLITLLTIQNVNDGLSAMQAFQHHKFTDEYCLPVERMTDLKFPIDEPICMRDWSLDQGCCDTCPFDEDDLFHASDKPCTHRPELSAFHHRCWNLTSFNDFFKKQWQFSLQKFSVRDFEYEDIEDDRILPFVLDDDSLEKIGNFSEVKKAWMLANHLLLPSNPDNESSDPATFSSLVPSQSQDPLGRIKVAIKTLKPLSQIHYNIKHEWKAEAEAYKALNGLKHPHIVKGLAAFRQRNKYHLLLEWANGGSLQTFWNSKPRRTLTRHNVKELLQQLHGLADALYNMHNTKIARSRRSSSRSRHGSTPSQIKIGDFQNEIGREQARINFVDDLNSVQTAHPIPTIRVDSPAMVPLSPVPTIRIDPFVDGSRTGNGSETAIDDTTPDDPQTENWRHGDIKPDNILRFIEQESKTDGNFKLGTLKLADLGRAKRHMNVTIERGDIEIDKWHTKKYEPPDIFIHGESRTTSRLYDIWSLGCVFFEAVVWVLYGHTEVTNFELTTTKRETEGTPYWTRIGDSAGVSQMAGLWMSSILRDDPECKGPKPSALADLMRLIQRKMLVVKLPPRSDEYTPGCRTNAGDVLRELTAILERANSEDEYLFTGEPRKGIKPPPSGKRANAQLNVVQPQGFVPASSSSGKEPGNTLETPRAVTASTTALRRPNQYTHALSDAWSYEDDDVFVKATLNKIFAEDGADTELFRKPKSRLCISCSAFDPSAVGSFQKRLLNELVITARKCQLCKLLLDQAKKANIAMTATISVDRQGGKLRINGKDTTELRICRSPDTPALDKADNSHIPIGILKLPDAGDETHIGILREWLNDCDKHGCIPAAVRMYCPRRLLYVGKELDKPCCRLVETARLGNQRQNLRYIALSHPWGDPAEHDHFKSTKRNLPEHMNGIDESELPQNFKDAISATRGLGLSYLWIDSICILQAADGDKGDFLDEAEHMQDIFSSAYCVIAASSAKGMSDGFLNLRDDAHVVALPPKDIGSANPAQFYISDIVDDFERDVEQGPLNQRGWVLQERALARRTIYFTENQTYWECGKGIRCETLSKLKSDEAAFLGDPEFPQFGTRGQPMGAQLFLFTGLYEQYSRLGFTHEWNKPVAIAGLEQRLTEKFADRSGAGIFANHRSRWLLWERANGVNTLKRIDFTTSTVKAPPSWSWMSYIGGITFLEPPKGQTDWNTDIELTLTGDGNTSWLYSKEHLAMRAPILVVDDATAANISTGSSTLSNPSQRAERELSLIFDVPNQVAGPHKHYVIVGTFGNQNDTSSRTYVLVVSPMQHQMNTDIFERIGAGWIPNRMVKTGSISSTLFSIV